VSVREIQSFAGESINVGCRDELGAVHANVTKAHIVRIDENNVGFVGSVSRVCEDAKRQQNQQRFM
jgi:hypothetical protein